MDVTPVLHLIGYFSDAGRAVAPTLTGIGFVTSALQFLVAHVVGSPRGQELGKAGMVGSVVGLVGCSLRRRSWPACTRHSVLEEARRHGANARSAEPSQRNGPSPIGGGTCFISPAADSLRRSCRNATRPPLAA